MQIDCQFVDHSVSIPPQNLFINVNDMHTLNTMDASDSMVILDTLDTIDALDAYVGHVMAISFLI